jgi:hypothetical protein
MMPRTHMRLTETGFSLGMGAALGTPVILSMPFFEGYTAEILGFVALPAFLAGVAIITFEKLHTPERD